VKQKLKNNKLQNDPKPARLLFLGVALVTLYFNPNIQDPFNTPKMILLLLISAWLLSHLLRSFKTSFLQKQSYRFIALILAITFGASLCFAYIFTDSKIIGLIGDTQRRNGLLSYLALIIFFLSAINSAEFKSIKQFIIIAIMTNFVLSSYGVIQILGKDFISWDNPYNNMIGTLGNPNFASALLSILGFISFTSIFLKEFPLVLKTLAFVSGFLSLWAIIKSDSRQGLIALTVSLLVFITFFIYLYSKIAGRILALFSFIIVVIGIMGMLQKGPLEALLYKNSVSVRGYYWRAGLEMFMNSPLTGIGLDSYNWYFKQYREVEYALTYGFNITSSNAHNTIIQLFATGGIFVGLGYLAIIALVIFCGILNIRKLPKDQKVIGIILFSAWIGFQAQSFVSIDNLGISIWGWVLGGLIVGVSQNTQTEHIKQAATDIRQNKISSSGIDALQPIVSAVLVAVSVVFSVFLYRAESTTYIARSYATMQNPTGQEIVKANYIKLVNNPLADPYYRFVVATALIDTGLDLEGFTEIKKLSEEDPRNLAYLNSIAYYSEILKDLPSARNSRVQIATLDPWNLRNKFLLGEIYAIEGDITRSNMMFREIIRVGPNSEEAALAKLKLGTS
jgi:O-antigen ligase